MELKITEKQLSRITILARHLPTNKCATSRGILPPLSTGLK